MTAPWRCPVCGTLNDTPVCPDCLQERPEEGDGMTYIHEVKGNDNEPIQET